MPAFLKAGLLCIGCALSAIAYGQDTREVPLGALPMQYNGGFAGEAGSPRVSTVAGVAFNYFFGNGHIAYTSYDQFIPAIRSGLGVTAGYTGSQYAGGYLANIADFGHGPYLSLAVAPKLSLGGKVTVSPSVDVSFYQGQAVFETTQGEEKYRVRNVRSRVGLLLNTDKFYVGYSVHLVDRFSVSPENGTVNSSSLNRFEKFNSYWQVGYTFGHPTETKFSVTPQLVLRLGSPRWDVGNGRTNFHPVDFNLNFRYQKVIWGVNLTGVHVGWQTERLRIMFSDSLDYLWNPGYAANLAVRYIFKS